MQQNSDDLDMKEWNGTILGPPHVCQRCLLLVTLRRSLICTLVLICLRSDVLYTFECMFLYLRQQTAHENRIYSLTLLADSTYPDAPPLVQFESKVNLTCVDARGVVSDFCSVGAICILIKGRLF
jgi:ubiquitin-conjugating enzyme E2 variant